jgi:hypothetical protein
LVKKSFGSAFCLTWLSGAKLIDTMSKGIRNAPGSALIGELAHQSGDSHAPAFALRQALTTCGALVGAVVAATAFKLTHRNYPLTFALSMLPATIACVMVYFVSPAVNTVQGLSAGHHWCRIKLPSSHDRLSQLCHHLHYEPCSGMLTV